MIGLGCEPGQSGSISRCRLMDARECLRQPGQNWWLRVPSPTGGRAALRKAETFFFNDTATIEIYTLSLHDALPISTPYPNPSPNPYPKPYPNPHPFILFFYFFIFLKFYYYLFLAALGLHDCMRAFSSCSKQGLLFIVVHRPLIAVASLVAERGL